MAYPQKICVHLAKIYAKVSRLCSGEQQGFGVAIAVGNAVAVVKDLWLRYSGSPWVLRGVNLELNRGEAVLIVGASGSGKTSLARALTGLAQNVFGAEVRGEVILCSRPLNEMDVYEVQRCVQLVNQDPYTHFLEPVPLDDLISYAEKLNRRQAIDAVRRVAQMMRVETVLEKPLSSLSGGQLRRLAIAKALLSDPEIVILDEPLMWLDDVDGVELVNSVVRELKRLRKSVVVMEHRFLNIINNVDRVYVLKNGILEPADAVSLKLSTGARDGEDYKCDQRQGGSVCKPVLELENVWFRYSRDGGWILKGVDLRVCEGDTVIIYGRNGEGKSTLLRIAAGALKPSKGYRRAYGDVLYVPQVPYLFITEDSILSEVKALCRSRRLGRECIESGVELVKKFCVEDLEALPINLSWGQQTRLSTVLAYSVVRRGGVILLDEPFTGSTYIDSVKLAELLEKLENASKIITLSSREYIPLFRNAKVYKLEDGVLKPCTISRDSFDKNWNYVLQQILRLLS